MIGPVYTPRGDLLNTTEVKMPSSVVPMRYPIGSENPIPSFVAESDPANDNLPRIRNKGDPVLCPCKGEGQGCDPSGTHVTHSVRECQRRYRDQGRTGDLTTSFYCRGRGEMKRGGRWHCPAHQADFCQTCEGPIGRNILARTYRVPSAGRRGRITYLP